MHPVPQGAWGVWQQTTAQALARLGYLVFDGEGYSMTPLQTALPLRALALCGYAEDPRAERAYEWLLALPRNAGRPAPG